MGHRIRWLWSRRDPEEVDGYFLVDFTEPTGMFHLVVKGREDTEFEWAISDEDLSVLEPGAVIDIAVPYRMQPYTYPRDPLMGSIEVVDVNGDLVPGLIAIQHDVVNCYKRVFIDARLVAEIPERDLIKWRGPGPFRVVLDEKRLRFEEGDEAYLRRIKLPTGVGHLGQFPGTVNHYRIAQGLPPISAREGGEAVIGYGEPVQWDDYLSVREREPMGPDSFGGSDEGSQYDSTPSVASIRRALEEG